MGHTFDELSGRIIEAAIAVHKALGPGFLESVYESAMRTALRHRGIVYESQKEVPVFFEGEEVGVHRLDLLVEGRVVVELKAIKRPLRPGDILPESNRHACWITHELQRAHADHQTRGSRFQAIGQSSGMTITMARCLSHFRPFAISR